MGAIYGAFAGAIVLVAWLWLTNVALLFGAELNAEIEREKELRGRAAARHARTGPNGAIERGTPAGRGRGSAVSSHVRSRSRRTPSPSFVVPDRRVRVHVINPEGVTITVVPGVSSS